MLASVAVVVVLKGGGGVSLSGEINRRYRGSRIGSYPAALQPTASEGTFPKWGQ
jgi:hypothetical protein